MKLESRGCGCGPLPYLGIVPGFNRLGGFPDQLAVAFPIALALGNLVDPPATMVNSAGDYVVSFIVSRYVDGKDWLQKALAKKKESKAIEQ